MMEKRDPLSQIDVALLTEDLGLAKEWNQVFRKTGIIPYVYQSLEDFWDGVQEKAPHLALVDIRQMVEGERQIRHHPLVQSKELVIAFYGNQVTAPLLYSTYEIFNLGTVLGGLPLEGQIKSVLRRFNEWSVLKAKSHLWEENGEKIEEKMTHLLESTESLKEKDFYQALLKSINGRFESYKEESLDFEHVCSRVFSTIPEICQFTVLELNQSGQKLLSPQLELTKFKTIPSLWLGQTCAEGIEFFAQNMASQVCLELMGGELMSLLIRGRQKNPEKIIFVRVKNEEFLNKFDWESFERYLSGLHSYYQVRNLFVDSTDKRVMEPWELFSFIDQVQFGKLPGSKIHGRGDDWALIDINFADLVQTVREKEGRVRFYWHRFFSDFFHRFEAQKKAEFRLTCFGVGHVVLLVEKEILDKTLNDLKVFSLRYSFWRYFEDVDIVLARNLKPEIRMIPLSGEAYLRYLETGDYLSREEGETKPVKEVSVESKAFWRPGPSGIM